MRGFLARVSGAAPPLPECVAETVLFALKQTGDSVVDELSVRAYP